MSNGGGRDVIFENLGMKIHYLDKDLLSFYSEIPDCNLVVILLGLKIVEVEKLKLVPH